MRSRLAGRRWRGTVSCLRSRLRDYPGVRSFSLALLCSALVLGAWAVASPPGSSPDEQFHLPSIWCASAGGSAECVRATDGSFLVPSEIVAASCHPHRSDVSGACAWTDPALSRPLAPVPADAVNAVVGSYPNAYYRLMHVLASGDVGASVLAIRLVNAALCIALLFATILLVSTPLRQALVLTWLIGVVPLGLFIIPSVNPSSWTVTGVGVLWASMLGLLEARRRRQAIALAAVSMVCILMCVSSRADAVVMAVAAIGVATALSPRARALFRRRWSALLAVAVGVIAALTVLVSATGQWRFVTAPITGLGNGSLTLFVSNLQEIPQLWGGAFGLWALGQLDVGMSAAVTIPMLLVVGGVILWGVADLSRWRAVLLGALGVALLIGPAAFLQSQVETVGSWVQPRYLLPVMLVTIGVALLPSGPEPRTLRSPQAWLIGIGTVVAAGVALQRVIRRYVTGVDQYSFNLNVGVEWWWGPLPPPMFVWGFGAIAFGLCAATALRYALTCRAPAGERSA